MFIFNFSDLTVLVVMVCTISFDRGGAVFSFNDDKETCKDGINMDTTQGWTNFAKDIEVFIEDGWIRKHEIRYGHDRRLGLNNSNCFDTPVGASSEKTLTLDNLDFSGSKQVPIRKCDMPKLTIRPKDGFEIKSMGIQYEANDSYIRVVNQVVPKGTLSPTPAPPTTPPSTPGTTPPSTPGTTPPSTPGTTPGDTNDNTTMYVGLAILLAVYFAIAVFKKVVRLALGFFMIFLLCAIVWKLTRKTDVEALYYQVPDPGNPPGHVPPVYPTYPEWVEPKWPEVSTEITSFNDPSTNGVYPNYTCPIEGKETTNPRICTHYTGCMYDGSKCVDRVIDKEVYASCHLAAGESRGSMGRGICESVITGSCYWKDTSSMTGRCYRRDLGVGSVMDDPDVSPADCVHLSVLSEHRDTSCRRYARWCAIDDKKVDCVGIKKYCSGFSGKTLKNCNGPREQCTISGGVCVPNPDRPIPGKMYTY